MEINKLHPELRKPYSRFPTLPVHNRVFYSAISFLMTRVIGNKIKPYPGVSVEDRALRSCNVRIYRTEGIKSTSGLLWIHGGGYILGNTGMNDKECSALARELGLLVVSVDYRLAPKYPFPAALDDCYEAWQFMQSSAQELAIEPSRIAIMGQSAGGGLAATLAQRIADAGGTQPACQVLMYPMVDDRIAANQELDKIKHRFWNNRNNRAAWSWYLGQAPGLENVPPYAVAARRNVLSGLPPAWICVGDLDLLYGDDCAYAEKLKAAGVDCELHIASQAPHAYDAVAPESSVTKDTVDRYCDFLRRKLHL